MSTGMRKWMEKDCPDIPSLPAEVSIDREELRQLRDELAQYKNERDALRANIEAMKGHPPYVYIDKILTEVMDNAAANGADSRSMPDEYVEVAAWLCGIPGAQPAPIEQDTSVRKAWARFSNELHRSSDAPYPGMSEAFEKHFSQSFTDREWRAESGVWAAAWKAAKNHGAQPTPNIPEDWLRAIDEALIVAHIGVANERDTYEQAKAKLDTLIGFHIDVTTDPAVNGGWKLVPIEPTYEMLEAGEGAFVHTYTDTPVSVPFDVYRAMIAAAPAQKENEDAKTVQA